MNQAETFQLVFLLLLNVTMVINKELFILFIESKPEGRKTVLGRSRVG